MGSSMAYPWADEVSHSFTIAEGPTGGSPLFGLRPRGISWWRPWNPSEPIMIHGYRSAEEAAKGSWRQKEAPRGRFATRIPIFEPKDAKWVHSPSEICILILFYRFFQSSNKSNHRVVTSKQATTGRNHRCSFSTYAITAGLRDQFGSAPSPL